jgi:hypothetical protein
MFASFVLNTEEEHYRKFRQMPIKFTKSHPATRQSSYLRHKIFKSRIEAQRIVIL